MHLRKLQQGQNQLKQVLSALRQPLEGQTLRMHLRGLRLEIWVHRQPAQALGGHAR